MIFGKTKMELKVGIFVFVGLVILVVFILSIGGFKTWTSGYKVNFIFDFVNGVKLGAPVRFAGVDVGEVKRINFITPEAGRERVEVVCWLKMGIHIPLDSTIWVNTLGLLGEKYIEIMPGKDYARFLSAGQSLEGINPIPLHEVFRLGKDIAGNINESVERIKNKEGTIGKLIYDDAIYKELEALIVDVRRHPWKLFWKTKEKPEKK
jgi:phospholipid/cholesterol/gamma-HCH transport system substrate-binding protein